MKKQIVLLICVLVIGIATVQAEAIPVNDDSWCPGCGLWQWIKKITETLFDHEKRLEALEQHGCTTTVVQDGGGSGFDSNTLSEYMVGRNELFYDYDTYEQYEKEVFVTKEELEQMFRYWDEEACKYTFPSYVKDDCIMQHRVDRTGTVQYLNGKEYVPS